MTDSLKRIAVCGEVNSLKSELSQGIIKGLCGNVIVNQQGTYEVFKESDSNILVYRVDIGNIYVIGSQQNCQVSFISLLRHIEAQYCLAILKGESEVVAQRTCEEVSELNHIGRSACHSDIHRYTAFIVLTEVEIGKCQQSACSSHLLTRDYLTGKLYAVYGSVRIYHCGKLLGAKLTAQDGVDQRLQGNLCSRAVIINECVIIKSNVGVVNECGCKTLHRGCHSRRIKGSKLHNDCILITVKSQSKYDLAAGCIVKLINNSGVLLFGKSNHDHINVKYAIVNDSFKLLSSKSVDIIDSIYLNAVDIIIVTSIKRVRGRQYD